ncbi:putative disease resistance protein [Salvia divinorum]|uniref:Disease resistance protein n=1 Tax=Salvia divinorum TaxID=28513 RepID=A0ABD1HZ02_SALDI
MAYNLQPLITILEGILDPEQTRWIVDENNPQLQSLLDKATSLQQLLDKSSLTKLDTQISKVAHQAEDIIESYMVDHMLSGSNCMRFTFSTPNLQQVTRKLDSVMKQAEKLVDKKMTTRKLDSSMEQVKHVDKKMQSSSSSSSVVVGIDKDLMQLKDRLAGMQTKLEIVPIVGMGGVDGCKFEREDETCDADGDESEGEEETCEQEWEVADGESAVASAKRIVEEQSENGNYDLKLRIANTKTVNR